MVLRSDNQRGEGRVGFIITLAVFIAMGFVAFKVLPVRIAAYQFRDVLRDEARYATAHHNDAETKKRILVKAESMNIPLDPDHLSMRVVCIRMSSHARFGNGSLQSRPAISSSDISTPWSR